MRRDSVPGSVVSWLAGRPAVGLAPLVLAVVVVAAVADVPAEHGTRAGPPGGAQQPVPADDGTAAPQPGGTGEAVPAEGPVATVPAPEKPVPPTQPPPSAEPLPVTPGLAPVIRRIETTDPVVFLTIDDGLVRRPDTLAAFAELGVPASLFLNDGPILKGADFFRSMAGTTVHAHTRHHPNLRRLSEEQQVEQICGNAELVASTFGSRPTLFRPPYGLYDEATRRAAARCGMAAVVLWEADVHRDRISFAHHASLRPGDIILMHFRRHFREELQTVARHVEEAGLRFARLEDYIVTAPRT